MRKFSLVLTLICVAMTAQATQIFSDGFNNVSGAPAGFTTQFSGDPIGPWTVGVGSVDWISTYWLPFEGKGSIDMSGDNAGSLFTALATIPGDNYVLSFYLAGNPDGGNTVKSLQVQVGNVNQPFTFDTTGKSSGLSGNMGWIQVVVPFTASADNTLTFTSNEQNAFGPALDLVTVDSVPEPATYTFGLIGFAGIGLGLFRRRR